MAMNLLAMVALRQEGGLFDINTGLSIWTVVIFVILLLVLYKFAYPPILGTVEARERRIQEILDAASQDRQEAERLLEEQRRELAEARQESQRLVAEGRQAAERMRDEFLDRARSDQEEMLARARLELKRERDAAIDTLRRETIDLSIAAASRLVERKLGADEDREIVRDYLERVGGPNGDTGAVG
jgi:F-type H+-transporting ATPase subunit b